MRRFRIHLSTLVILSFAAGGIIWLNLRHREVDSSADLWLDDEANDRNDRYFGWPYEGIKPQFWSGVHETAHVQSQFYSTLVKNVLVGVTLLFALAVCVEYLPRLTARARASSQ